MLPQVNFDIFFVKKIVQKRRHSLLKGKLAKSYPSLRTLPPTPKSFLSHRLLIFHYHSSLIISLNPNSSYTAERAEEFNFKVVVLLILIYRSLSYQLKSKHRRPALS